MVASSQTIISVFFKQFAKIAFFSTFAKSHHYRTMEQTAYTLLDKVNSPADIKCLTIEELKVLCQEIRNYMIECCAVNPGHLGPSLGAVELIVGFHYVYDAPQAAQPSPKILAIKLVVIYSLAL